MESIKRIIAAFFDFLQGIVVLAAIFVMIYLFILSPQEISGSSMEPNFFDKEYILTYKVEYKLNEPQRGDVVIFKSPKNKEIDYIKRIIGLPGERVLLKNSTFYINGQPIREPYLPKGLYVFSGSYLPENSERVIPEGQYFVVGDNRPHSSDSREFGPIAKEEFIGKAFFRYWPLDRAGIILRPEYNIR